MGSASELLLEATALPWRRRTQRMIDVGEAVACGDSAARLLVAELAQHPEVFARSLALQTVIRTRDDAHLVRALEDPSSTLRMRARRLAVHAGSDEVALRALSGAGGTKATRRFAQLLARAGRRVVVDRFLASLPPDRARMRDTLAAFGTAREEPSRWFDLASLLRHHPTIAARTFHALLLGGEATLDVAVRYRLASVGPLLAKLAPDAALGVLRRLRELGESPRQAYIRTLLIPLTPLRPRETFDLLRDWQTSLPPMAPPGLFAGLSLGSVAAKLGAERLGWLVEHAASALPDDLRARRWMYRLDETERAVVVEAWLARGKGAWGAFLLREVPPGEARREHAYLRWRAAAADAEGIIPVARLVPLPRDLRAREAERHLRLPALQMRLAARVSYAELLPLAAAKEAVAEGLAHPDGEVRAPAMRALIRAVIVDAPALPAALQMVTARSFEQDPVRLAMIGALAELPLGHFSPAHRAALDHVLQAALDAADLSQATAAAAERLVGRLFRLDASWSAVWLTRILEARGQISGNGLGEGLLPRDVRALDPELASLARGWAQREHAHAVLRLANALGRRRLRHAPSLLDALEALVSTLPSAAVAERSLELLRLEAPRRFYRIVPELLRKDPSFATLASVRGHLSAERQDLLLLALGDAPLEGRFATGKVQWVLDFGLRFGRWTAEAERRYARQLVRLTEPERGKTDTPRAHFAIARLARLVDAPPAALLGLARDRRPVIREVATRALAWLDDASATTELLAALGDERARWAIYALRHRLAELSPARVVSHLRGVSLAKVTVAKEVVRLLGELGGDEGWAEVLRIRDAPLHRDVRIATLRAAWSHLDRDDAWALLADAADDPEGIVASRLADIPADALTADGEARLTELLARVLRRPEPQTRAAVLRQAPTVPLRDETRLFLRVLLASMGGSPDESAAATDAVLTRMRPSDLPEVEGRILQLVPRRRLLGPILDKVSARARSLSSALTRELGTRLAVALAAVPELAPQRIALAGVVFEPGDFATHLEAAAARDELHVDAMNAAFAALAQQAEVAPLEAALAGAQDPRLRRLALAALVHDARAGRGWNDERRARLEALSRDPSPAVAGPASFVFPPL